ncbi:unnamed protein product [Plasmodium vivax]|uniref:(malaria parasite P. vivax) hypothetical protein n=1 Tax=Plasmodium vivax TaxID=5855 RepID=A0A8S4HBH4_PLAVI|nr:unnamed protein product [Plasmodium vivax]
MWKRQTRTYNGVSAILRSYQEPACLNKYSNIKGEIQDRIAELTKNHSNHFCKKCDGIKKDIFKKNTELDFCYSNNYLRSTLLEDSVIKDFIKDCTEPSNCRNSTIDTKKPVASTEPKDVSCRKGSTGCKQSAAKPKTEEGKSQPRSDAETSKIIGLEGSTSVKQGQDRDDGVKSRSENLQTKPGTTPSHIPIETNDKAPEQLDNKHNATSEEGATQVPGLSQVAPSTSSNLGDTSSDPSHQHNSQPGSDVNSAPQETILDTECTQRNSCSVKDLDGNSPDRQTAANGIAGRQDGFLDVTTSENPDGRSNSDKIGGDEKASVVGNHGGVRDDIAPVTLPVSNECPNPGTPPCENGGSKHSGDQISNTEAVSEVTSGKVHTESTSDSHSASGSIGAGNDSDDAANNQHLLKSVDEEKQHGQETAHAEAGSYKSDKPTNNPQLHQSDSSFVLTYLPSPSGQNLLESSQENHGVTGTLGRGSSVTAGMAEETVKYENDNGLGILSQFFNNIPHKDYMMMGFIPMVFILLLILLMKYTPLRAIFAKKKKKKRNDMNEKLQRVLFEPSNGSEEKRIPFSYSAFEYST